MKTLIALLTLMISSTAFAASCDSLPSDSEKLACYERSRNCAEMVDAQARLSCFDELFATTPAPTPAPVVGKSTSAEVGTTPVVTHSDNEVTHEAAAAAVTAVPSSVEKSREDDLKFPLKAPPSDQELEIEAVVTRITDGGFRMDYITLDNEQVWKETTAHTVRLKVGQAVTITEGILGSTHLSAAGSNRKIRVKRVK
jgi:hypothetical protein